MRKHLNRDGKPFHRKGGAASAAKAPTGERLSACAIRHASGDVSDGHRSHYALRSSLGYNDASRFDDGDVAGFMTSTGRFLTRAEAVPVAVAAGQIDEEWLTVRREMLSSDLNWGAAK